MVKTIDPSYTKIFIVGIRNSTLHVLLHNKDIVAPFDTKQTGFKINKTTISL